MASKYQAKVGGPTDLRIFYSAQDQLLLWWSLKQKSSSIIEQDCFRQQGLQLSNPFLNGLCMALSTFLLHLICGHIEIGLFSFVTDSKCENELFAKLNFHLMGFHQAWYFLYQDNIDFSEEWSLVGVFQHCICTSVLLRIEWLMGKTRSPIPGDLRTPTSFS